MTSKPRPLDLNVLRRALVSPAASYSRVELAASTGSTNADLVAAAASPDRLQWPDLSALVAEMQLAGRGRLDRQWVSPAGSSMIVSVLLRPGTAGRRFPPRALSWLSLLAAIALIDALGSTAGIKADLKWPNDVLVKGQKLAGILAQLTPAGEPTVPGSEAGPAVVVGTGVNVTQRPEELPVDTATSLAIEGAVTLDRNVLLPAYLARFGVLYLAFCAAEGDPRCPLDGGGSLMQRATAAMVTLGTQVRADLPGDKSLYGVAVGLDATGSLLLTDAQGSTHVVSAGDVVHLRRHEAGGAGVGDPAGSGWTGGSGGNA